MRLLFRSSLVLVISFRIAEPVQAETYVTTYVTKVQEERKSTRWTLTEWLHIKERMKLMDVWLAMFSDPKKDAFRPELSLSGGLISGSLKQADNLDSKNFESNYATAQLWMTNLVSSTVGIRTLNIDWGFEGGLRTGTTDYFNNADSSLQLANDSPKSGLGFMSDRSVERQTRNYYTANLRIFGKNIQDSSITLKYGRYNQYSGWALATEEIALAKSRNYRGTTYGGDMQLYLFKWLGAEGSYQAFDKASADDMQLNGTQYSYGPYIEISLFRFMGGIYQEDWTLKNTGTGIGGQFEQERLQETGYYYGLKLQL